MARAASQKLMAFSGPLGVMKSGMPAYDRACDRSSSATPSRPMPSTRARPLRRYFCVTQAMLKTMAATAIDSISMMVCSGR